MKGVIATVGVMGAITLTGCGGDDSGSSSSAESSSVAAAPSNKVRIADFEYDPDITTVNVGTEVTWTNTDGTAHTATADDGSFDTGDLDRGDSKSITLDKPGIHSYYCRFHPFMKATIEVE